MVTVKAASAATLTWNHGLILLSFVLLPAK
jgi:hypothetical protein